PTHHGRVDPPLAPTEAIEATLTRLGAVVDRQAADPDNPWAIAHGLVARGPTFILRNDRRAVDWLFERYARELAGHPSLLAFPEAIGDIRIEPHTDLVLKSLVDAGVAPEHPVVVDNHPHRVVDLWRGSVISSYLDPATNHSRYGSPDDIAWSLHGIAAWAPPKLRWTALDGTPMDLDELTDFAVAVLYKETRFLAEAAARGEVVRRQGQGIFHYTCGGAHLLQGAAFAVARGHGSPQAPALLREQALLMQVRLQVEPEITRQAAAALPEHADRLTVQRLKFAGHYLETMSRLIVYGMAGEGDDARRARDSLAVAAQEVVDASAILQQRGLLDDLDAVRARDEQLYLDIVGDSAHALHGLELALGRSELSW
ncbi:MAG: hypothetical protein D6798_14495, partial [Deltaproteobacteria bacterium]